MSEPKTIEDLENDPSIREVSAEEPETIPERPAAPPPSPAKESVAPEPQAPAEPEPEPQAPEEPAPQPSQEDRRDRDWKAAREQRKRLEDENKRLKAQLAGNQPPTRQPQPADFNVIPPFRPDDKSAEAERYWAEQEQETGVDRAVIYWQAKKTVETYGRIEQAKEEVEKSMTSMIEDIITDNPEFEEVRALAESDLRKLPYRSRVDPEVIAIAMERHYGRLMRDRARNGGQPAPKADEPETPPAPRQPLPRANPIRTSAPSRPPAARQKAPTGLTPEQRKFAEDKGLTEAGMDIPQIVTLFERFQKTRK